MMRTVAILKHADPVSRLLRRDVEEGVQEGSWGRIMAHWAGEQIRRDVLVDYVRPLVPETTA